MVRKGDFHFYSLMLSSCLAGWLDVCLSFGLFVCVYWYLSIYVYLYISLIVVRCGYCMYVIEVMNDNLINVSFTVVSVSIVSEQIFALIATAMTVTCTLSSFQLK